jgi:hypothetical protein
VEGWYSGVCVFDADWPDWNSKRHGVLIYLRVEEPQSAFGHPKETRNQQTSMSLDLVSQAQGAK